MVCVTLEGLCMVSDRIVDFRFFIKFHRSGHAIFFRFSTITEHVSYPSKMLLIKQKTSSTGESYSERIMDGFWWNCWFSIFRQISQVRTCNNFQFLNTQRTCQLCIKKAPKQAKDLINMVSGTLKGLWMVADGIVDFRFFVKFDRSGPAIIFSFWTLREHVSYASKDLLNKKKTSSTWWVFLWKDYRCFLIELSIFDFSSNFTGPDLQ